MQPLQTHGQYHDVWYPPTGGRFIVYDESDSEWMKSLGLGIVERELKPLYDVRTGKDCVLVGYTKHSPMNAKVRGFLVVPVQQRFTYWGPNKNGPVETPIINIEVCPRKVAVDFRHYLCWLVEDRDVETLKQTSFLAVVEGDGDDTLIKEFIRAKRRGLAK